MRDQSVTGAPHELPTKERRKWSFSFGAVEFFYWFALAANGYLTIYLASQGFSVAQVSIIGSVNSAVSILGMPLGGAIADKLQSSRKALNIYIIGIALTSALVPLTAHLSVFGFPIMLIFVVLNRFFISPTNALLDTTVINGCHKTGSFYGLVRSAGSFSYIIMNLVLGAVIIEQNSYLTFYVLAVFLLPCVWYLIKLKPVSDTTLAAARPLSFREMPFGKLFRNPYYIAYLIFSVINSIPLVFFNTFQPYLIKEVGGNMALIGYLQAYRASFEIPMLLLSRKMDTKLPYRVMVVLSAALYGAQSLMYGLVDSFALIIVATTLSGIASGFTQAGAARFVLELAPRELQATAQTLVSACSSVSGILGGLLVGLIPESASFAGIYVVTGFIIMGIVGTYALSFPFIRKVLKKEFVDYGQLY